MVKVPTVSMAPLLLTSQTGLPLNFQSGLLKSTLFRKGGPIILAGPWSGLTAFSTAQCKGNVLPAWTHMLETYHPSLYS
jgi:hypothetical protein